MHMPNPERFGEGMDHVNTRWIADPKAAFAAEVDGKLVGSNFATRWGSFGFFGPLTVDPDFWDKGVGTKLLEPAMQLFDRWSVSHVALFTFAQSPKHVALYEKFGFWPRYLTPVMSKTAQARNEVGKWSTFSNVRDAEKEQYLAKCQRIADSAYRGLDLRREILAVRDQKLGDTVMVWEGDSLIGFAVCHCGEGTEAGGDTCYIKFGTAGKGSGADHAFGRLLNACEEYARVRGMASVLAGINTACHNAYRQMLGKGYRSEFQGVMMSRPNVAAFDELNSYVICDLR
jgi:hypothetical protein